MAIEYCKEFNVDIEEYEDDTSEVKVKFLWEKIIIDYGFLKGRDVSEIKIVSLLFEKSEFPIVHKNLDFLNKMGGVKEITIDGSYSYSDDEIKNIFLSINCNNISGFWIGFDEELVGNRVLHSILRMASDFFPNIKMLCVGYICLPSNEGISDISFLSNLRNLEHLLLYRCKSTLELEVLLKMNSLKTLALSGEIDTVEFQEQVKKLRENRPELKIDFY